MKFLHMNVYKINTGKFIKSCQNELEIKKIWMGENIDLTRFIWNLYEKNDQG